MIVRLTGDGETGAFCAEAVTQRASTSETTARANFFIEKVSLSIVRSYPWPHLHPAACGHQRRAKKNDDNGEKLAMDDLAKEDEFFRLHGRHLTGPHRLAPGQEFQSRQDRQCRGRNESGEFRQKGVAMPVIVRTFLEIEDAH